MEPALPEREGAELGATGSNVISDSRPAAAPSASGTPSSARRSQSWRTDDLNVAMDGTAPDGAADEDAGEELDIRAAPGMLWTLLASLAVGIILSTVIAGGYFLIQHLRMADGTDASAAQSPRREAADVHWTDAVRHGQRIAPITVRVERVKYGALRVKDLRNEVITTEDRNLLGITVSVAHGGQRAREFTSWYGHVFEADDGGEQIAELVDDQGRSYASLKFDDVTYIEGQRLADAIRPRRPVQDTVVFLVPDEVDRAQVKYFRLSLPAAAVGLTDYFRFQIPVQMVEGFVGERADAGTAAHEEFPLN